MRSPSSTLIHPENSDYELPYALGRKVTFTSRVEGINFEALSLAGTSVAILDCDSTISEHGDSFVYPEVMNALRSAQDLGYLATIALVSNNPDRDLMDKRATQLGIDSRQAFTPKKTSDMKPGTRMIKKALATIGVPASRAVGIGDGITDAVAYIGAGIDVVLVHPSKPERVRGYPCRGSVRRCTNYLLRLNGVNRYPAE